MAKSSQEVNFGVWGTPSERLMRKVEYDTNGGCWLCIAGNARGYGRLRVGNKKKALAHRVSYQSFIGPIPKGMWVLHKCDVPACINPSHLFLGNAQDNVDDMMRKGRFVPSPRRPGSTNPRAVLTDADVLKIRQSSATEETLALLYGVTRASIGRVRRRETWTHI
jgi:hypothetical protein